MKDMLLQTGSAVLALGLAWFLADASKVDSRKGKRGREANEAEITNPMATIVSLPSSDFKADLALIQSSFVPTTCISVPYKSPGAVQTSAWSEDMQPEVVTVLDENHAQIDFYAEDPMDPGRHCCMGSFGGNPEVLHQTTCWQTHVLTPINDEAYAPAGQATSAVASLNQEQVQVGQSQTQSTVVIMVDEGKRHLAVSQLKELAEHTNSIFVVDPVTYIQMQGKLVKRLRKKTKGVSRGTTTTTTTPPPSYAPHGQPPYHGSPYHSPPPRRRRSRSRRITARRITG